MEAPERARGRLSRVAKWQGGRLLTGSSGVRLPPLELQLGVAQPTQSAGLGHRRPQVRFLPPRLSPRVAQEQGSRPITGRWRCKSFRADSTADVPRALLSRDWRSPTRGPFW